MKLGSGVEVGGWIITLNSFILSILKTIDENIKLNVPLTEENSIYNFDEWVMNGVTKEGKCFKFAMGKNWQGHLRKTGKHQKSSDSRCDLRELFICSSRWSMPLNVENVFGTFTNLFFFFQWKKQRHNRSVYTIANYVVHIVVCTVFT